MSSTTSARLTTPEGPASGHRLAGQAPTEMLAALMEFPAPYRESGGGLR